jgi:hypothetical protein
MGPLIFEISDPMLSPRQQAEAAGKILYLHLKKEAIFFKIA